MNKYVVLKKNDEFNLIIKEGKKITNSDFIVYFLPSIFFESSEPKVGLSVGKKLGNAPFRNYQKRRLRMIVQQNVNLLSNNHYVFILRPRGCKSTFKKLSENYVKVCKEIYEE